MGVSDTFEVNASKSGKYGCSIGIINLIIHPRQIAVYKTSLPNASIIRPRSLVSNIAGNMPSSVTRKGFMPQLLEC